MAAASTVSSLDDASSLSVGVSVGEENTVIEEDE